MSLGTVLVDTFAGAELSLGTVLIDTSAATEAISVKRSIILSNTIDYISWRGDLDFRVSPFCEVDAFICTQLSTVDYAGIVSERLVRVPLYKAAERYFESHTEDYRELGILQAKDTLRMLKAAAGCERYRRVSLRGYVNRIRQDENEQFSALIVTPCEGLNIIVFRGTDDTIIGWKEDFYLSVYPEVPAQRDALGYLTAMAGRLSGRLILCGHSKGGNLAVYAASHVPGQIRDRIDHVYNFDGPGLSAEALRTPEYLSVRNRITTILPKTSLVGMLLCMAGKSKVVETGMRGIWAHDGFNWEVMGTGFIEAPELSPDSRKFGSIVSTLLGSMDQETRKAFADELFDALLDTGSVTLTDITMLSAQAKLELLKKLRRGKYTRQFAGQFVEEAVRLFIPEITEPIRTMIKKP